MNKTKITPEQLQTIQDQQTKLTDMFKEDLIELGYK